MIETEQTVTIGVGIDAVWAYVEDMERWAALMPGMREYDVINADDSRWTLKVGVGGLVRTVKVLVHVDEWAGPERARFTYRLEGDPVQGGGSYLATRKGPHETEVLLKVRVEGGGPLAPMWEAMGRPLLPKLAQGFANQLRDAIEAHAAQHGAAVAAPSTAGESGLLATLCAFFRRLFGRGAASGDRS